MNTEKRIRDSSRSSFFPERLLDAARGLLTGIIDVWTGEYLAILLDCFVPLSAQVERLSGSQKRPRDQVRIGVRRFRDGDELLGRPPVFAIDRQRFAVLITNQVLGVRGFILQERFKDRAGVACATQSIQG